MKDETMNDRFFRIKGEDGNEGGIFLIDQVAAITHGSISEGDNVLEKWVTVTLLGGKKIDLPEADYAEVKKAIGWA